MLLTNILIYWFLNQKDKGRWKDAEELQGEYFCCERECQTSSEEVICLMNLMDVNKSISGVKNKKTFPSFLPNTQTSHRVSKWSWSLPHSHNIRKQDLKSELGYKSYQGWRTSQKKIQLTLPALYWLSNYWTIKDSLLSQK